jgi:hypothetical protein
MCQHIPSLGFCVWMWYKLSVKLKTIAKGKKKKTSLDLTLKVTIV